ncbi:hypothetical protein IEC97_18930 [Neobacillus cucumis]|uniref:hypothetical protein n=1 Tax=Neobacillus cucumis TaxID=1740721 RepID=UPI0018DFFE45|nr:hypothetical protein [Neobacillus cucumis]MBI0579452.1 hypothetical protein [Neobacillus cucumis]
MKNKGSVIFLLAVRIIINSLVLAVVLYATIVILPDTFHFSVIASKWLFFTITAVILIFSKEKWWSKLIALIFAVVIDIVFIILFNS